MRSTDLEENRENLNNMIKRIFYCLAFLLLVHPGALAADKNLFKKEATGSWQRNVTRDIIAQPIDYGQALYWRLDNNGFAVKIPGYFIVFDYANDIPTGQWEFGKLLDGKELNRSLLTGVFEPEEFEDLFPNDIAVVVYSHLHPAEKTLRAAFDWSKQFKKIIYIGPQEVYELYRRVVSEKMESAKGKGLKAAEEQMVVSDEIESAETEDPEALEEQISDEEPITEEEIIEEDALAMFRIAKPELPISISGLTVMPYKPHDPLAEVIGEVLEGLEYVVETDNGVNLYHSGALGCRVCLDESEFLSVRESPNVISVKTQNLVFCDKKIVKMNRKRVDICPGEEKRIGFALYVSKDFDGVGAITVWADGKPDSRFPMAGTGITQRTGKLVVMQEKFLGEASANPFGDYDIQAREILKQRLEVEKKYMENLKDTNPQSVFHYNDQDALFVALQGNTTYASQRGRLDVRDQLHEIQSDLVMKAFRDVTLPPKLDWFPLILTNEPRGDCVYTKSGLFMKAFIEGALPLKLGCFPLAMPNLPRGYCHHFNRVIYFTGYVLGSYPELWRSSSKVVQAYVDEEERRRQEAILNGEEWLKIKKSLTSQPTTQDYIKERKEELALKESEALQRREQEKQEAQAEREEPEPAISRLEEFRLKREAERIKTEEMRFRRDLEEEQRNLKFGKVSMLIASHYYRYQGTVTNKGKWNKPFLTIKMSFFDEKGQVDHYEQALTRPLHIKPDETATFTIYTEKTDPPPKYELSATWDLDEESENSSGGSSGL